ncbi:unnamed protein product [Rotaria sp. Silwood1]|nr:unnamed protein product [Rotaria sp. Silwood1]CAF1658877.1 unnamed protein product [Rotaria sp. Silwood1]CAF3664065.1 unnamed protein product [Rotaria sp. Silwood1]CAF3706418.1 unnamed protein product [Rotaria sp. Silwood1]CAF3900927.1 unnamed protein product [Rotaria sp. Silwood1]
MNIRSATTSDVEAIVHVHYEAVHGTKPANFYTQDIIQNWSPSPTDEFRLNQFRHKIDSGDQIFVVAELENKLVIGFGSIIPSQYEICALYVDPMYGHQGVGTKILEHLETLAL